MARRTVTTSDDWPHPVRAWTGVAVLMACYATAFVDRQILTLLVEPIRRDLGLSDTQFSLLSGLAFTLFYSVLGIPLAMAADRGSRRNLIMLSVAVWTAMTAACGMANSFFSLFLARIGVGIGEAGLSPAAYSLIADSFPPARRARAMGVYSTGSVMGVGLALIIGGSVVQWALTAPPVTLPWVGELRSWQLALLIVSLPGPLLVTAMSLLREPARKLGAAGQSDSAPLAPFLRKQWRTFALLSSGYALIGVTIAAYLSWAPAFFIRAHGWEVGKVGVWFGLIVLIGSTLGIQVGGWWSDRLTGAGRKDGALLVALFSSAAALPLAVAAPFAPSGEWAALILAVMFIATGLTLGLPPVSLQAIAPNRLRARVMAVYLLIVNLIAFTVGPTVVAVISDSLFQDPAKIGMATAIVAGAVLPLAMAALALARRPYLAAVAALSDGGQAERSARSDGLAHGGRPRTQTL